MNRILLILGLVVLVASCTPDEPLINNFDDTWRLLASDGSSLAVYAMPAGTAQRSDVWNSPSGPATVINEFRDHLYVLPSTEAWIVTLDRMTLVPADTIFTDTLGPASDIAFANATTAYAVHPSKSVVSVIDITTNQIVRTIAVNGGAHSIVALGNQIAVTCFETNSVQIIDSRTNAVEATIGVPEVPYYVRASVTQSVFVVVSLGRGKLTEEEQTPAQISFINPMTRSLISSLELTGRAAEAFMQFPKGLVVTPSGFAYVPVQSALLRANVRSRTKSSVVTYTNYAGISYNGARGEVLLLREDGPTIEVWNELIDAQKGSVTLRQSPGGFVGLPRD